jgi:UDP-N-acetylmuramoyl-L-alanyl-D-glutamate--2,6-diaminopimelate ligase
MNMMTDMRMPAALADLNAVCRALDQLPVRIMHVTSSSREVRAGSLFLAYPGSARDGRQFIADAIQRGAVAILYEAGDAVTREAAPFAWQSSWTAPALAVSGLKSLASGIGAHLYRHPANHLWMIGVTGTNGKTSVSQWVAQALEASGKRSAILGTIGNGLVGALSAADNTTPDALMLQKLLREYVDQGASACAMEVSSHGLNQGRVADVKFDVAVFTNLTRDHLDYHGTMQAYGEAKAMLFAKVGLKTAVINLDDAFGRELASRCAPRGIEVIGYATETANMALAILRAENISVSAAGLSFTVRVGERNQLAAEHAEVCTPILGAFNVSNLLAVIGSLLASGVDLSEAARLVAHLKPVPGRMQTVRATERPDEKPLVVVDYAHTPDALEKVLSTVAAVVPQGGRLISVFGCGGDRDRGKRPIMALISARLATLTVITSDNPRSESPERIIADIVAGIGSAEYRVVGDRHQAIFEALNLATAKDIVVIAGKGHEDYQIIGETRQHFCDAEVALDALAVWHGHSGSNA